MPSRYFMLGGWWRLWVVLVVAYGAAIFAITWSRLPDVKQIRWNESHLQLLSDRSLMILASRTQSASSPRGGVGSKSKYEEARAAGYSHDEIRDYLLSKGLESPIWTFEMPNGHVFEVPANTTKDEASEVGRDYMRLLERLKWERWKEMLTKSLIIWMVPSLLALALGWSVGWIWKGFRIKA